MVLPLPPLAELTVWSLALSFLMALVYRIFGKPGAVRELKEKRAELDRRTKEARKAGNKAEVEKLTTEMLELHNRQMKGNLKPMLVSMALFLGPLWFWFPQAFAGMKTLLPFELPLFGADVSWLGWYILVSIPSNVLFRKMLGMDAA